MESLAESATEIVLTCDGKATWKVLHKLRWDVYDLKLKMDRYAKERSSW